MLTPIYTVSTKARNPDKGGQPLHRVPGGDAVFTPGTWPLINQHAAGMQEVSRDQLCLCRLGRHIWISLGADCTRRASVSGGDIEAILASDPPLI